VKYKNGLTGALALACLLPALSHATNGYMLHGYGKNKGMGGAGIANPQDALAAATNPAGTVWVGEKIDLYGEFFHPRRGYDFDGNNGFGAGDAFGVLGVDDKMQSDKDIFLIPAFGMAFPIDDISSWGVSVYGAGLGSEYNRNDTTNLNVPGAELNGTFFDGSTGVDLLLVMSNWNYSRKITENSSWGFGVILATQSFKAKGLTAFGQQGISTEPNFVTDKGRDWAFGYGANIGIQAELIPGFTVAGSYQTEVGLRHESYKGLFANDGDLSLPAQWVVGMTWKPNKTSALSFDVQQIYWSETKAVGNEFSSLLTINVAGNNIAINSLGQANSAGFGWEDSLVYKLGYQWEMNMLPSWTWRVGFAYQDQIVPTSETLFGTLAPGVIKEHYTFGFTKEFDSGSEMHMNFLYAPKEVVRGSKASKGVDIYLEEYGLEIGWTWNFN
jgi:long-chain fatty acid transport protein